MRFNRTVLICNPENELDLKQKWKLKPWPCFGRIFSRHIQHLSTGMVQTELDLESPGDVFKNIDAWVPSPEILADTANFFKLQGDSNELSLQSTILLNWDGVFPGELCCGFLSPVSSCRGPGVWLLWMSTRWSPSERLGVKVLIQRKEDTSLWEQVSSLNEMLWFVFQGKRGKRSMLLQVCRLRAVSSCRVMTSC